MKNLFLLPTEKPSRLAQVHKKLSFFKNKKWDNTENWRCKNIYITNDEDIIIGDYYIAGVDIYQCLSSIELEDLSIDSYCKKIILTTDQDLIKDGVQAIDDEFLEWFVKNPSCEFVELKQLFKDDFGFWVSYLDLLQNEPLREVESKYKIIIPKEEPAILRFPVYNETKQETLENIKQFEDCIKTLDENFSQQETLEEVFDEIDDKLCRYSTEESEHWIHYKIGVLDGLKWQQEQDKKMYSEEDMKHAFFSGCQSERQIKPRVKCWEEFIEKFKNK